MSERLSTLGRAGAEEVNGVMNATFAGLLDVAYRYGGGLLKFGGDALLLFYEGDDHAARAATAAFRMRALLKQIGRPATLGGRVTLRMHVGIHSGPFEFFLVGSSHRELVVAGPDATRTVEMEGLAAADEILLSDEAAALVSARLLGDARPDGGRLLRGDPKASPLEAPLPEVSPRDLALLVPPMVRDVVTSGTVEAEHRHACVAFVHFGGTDAALVEDAARPPSAAVEAGRPGRAGRGRPLRRLLPRDRHRRRRRQDRPRRRRPGGVGERRGADAPHAARRRSTSPRRCRCAPASTAGACSPARSARRSAGRTRSSATPRRSPRG